MFIGRNKVTTFNKQFKGSYSNYQLLVWVKKQNTQTRNVHNVPALAWGHEKEKGKYKQLHRFATPNFQGIK